MDFSASDAAAIQDGQRPVDLPIVAEQADPGVYAEDTEAVVRRACGEVRIVGGTTEPLLRDLRLREVFGELPLH